MKVYLKTIACTGVMLFNSCNKREPNTHIAVEEEKIEIQSEPIKPTAVEMEVSDRIVGKYYVVFFSNFLSDGFELLIEKPKDYFILYAMEFKNTGEIIFDDLTEFYDCGNGVLSIQKGVWKVNEAGIYELTFDGKYALDFNFHSVSTYRLVALKNGDLKMKLIEVLRRDTADYSYDK